MDAAPDLSLYVRLISGMILGLTVGKLLSGLAKFVQHPHEYQMNILHGLWIFFIFGAITVFWWGEAQSFAAVQWTYPLYLFQIAYCASYLFITAVLLPDEVTAADGVENHYQYFIARRHWFFGALIFSHLLDLFNTAIKFGLDDYPLTAPFFVFHGLLFGLLILALVSPRRAVQIAVAVIMTLLTAVSMLVE
jgi:F0F1-type ATP synthase assembly protein I